MQQSAVTAGRILHMAVEAAQTGEDTLPSALDQLPAAIYVTDSRQAAFLRSQARKCRRLAMAVSDQQTADTLTLMAAEYEQKANELSAT